MPTAPRSNIVGHVVRLYGAVDGTHLTYAPAKPPCHPITHQCPPDTLNAGEFVEVPINVDFEVIGDQPFAVGSFMIGSANLDPYTAPPKQEGDPAQSNFASVELLAADKPFGLQVIGYGASTSYYYPGGLNLDAIAPPPPPIK